MFRLIVWLGLLVIASGYGDDDHRHHHHHHHGPPSGGSNKETGGVNKPVAGGQDSGKENVEFQQNFADRDSTKDDITDEPNMLADRINIQGDVSKVRQIFGWKQMTYDFGSEAGNVGNPAAADDPGQESDFYIPYNNIPVGIERWNDKIFITVPRRAWGIPSSVNWISLSEKNKSPALKPYPSLAANTYYGRSNLQSDPPIVSVYRPKVDNCDRLWLIDCGKIEAKGGRQILPPSIVIYDLKTDTLIRRFEFPSTLLKNGATTGLISITVDTEDGDCSNAFAYVPDIFELGLIIYSFKQNRGWRMTHSFFSMDPMRSDFNVNGFQYQWRDDIFSVVLSTRNYQGKRITYALFHPMATYKEFAVSTEVLQNEKLATRSYHFNDIKILGERGNLSQSSMHGIDARTGVVFFSQVAKNGVACWNSHRPLIPRNVQMVAQDDELLFYPADLKVDGESTVWILSNKMPQYFFGDLDVDQYNFRVFKMNVQNAIANTVCAI